MWCLALLWVNRFYSNAVNLSNGCAKSGFTPSVFGTDNTHSTCCATNNCKWWKIIDSPLLVWSLGARKTSVIFLNYWVACLCKHHPAVSRKQTETNSITAHLKRVSGSLPISPYSSTWALNPLTPDLLLKAHIFQNQIWHAEALIRPWYN